jgi:hypothetical protein
VFGLGAGGGHPDILSGQHLGDALRQLVGHQRVGQW